MHVLIFLGVVVWLLSRQQAKEEARAALPSANELMFYGQRRPSPRKKKRGFFRSLFRAMGLGAIAVTLYIALQGLAMVIISHQI